MSSGEINHASPSGRLTDTSGCLQSTVQKPSLKPQTMPLTVHKARMRKRIREHDAGSPDSDQPTKMFSRSEVQGLLQQEVHSAMKQSESKMESLLERVQLLECEPKYDLVIRRLEAHIKKVKRRGDVAISYVRMLRAPGVKHNQRTLGSGLVDLTETDAERGLSTVDISRSDSDEDDQLRSRGRGKVVDGFWQKMVTHKERGVCYRYTETRPSSYRYRPTAPALVIHWRVTSYRYRHTGARLDSYRPLALPMAVTVTKYQSGTTYVIVVGKDRYGRYGPYSDVQTVLLA
ncbi:uncharacterized protein LOC135534124 [Oncorhynchus masou masou]|uniref:uncharacterized protein LOC135534124 n=1 Tax=Oncorhynchus masou masou TaxID=90313 RepID=UPI0031837804